MKVPRYRMPALSLDSHFLKNAIESKQLARGESYERFRKIIADKLGFKSSVLCSNGFSAIQLGIETLGIKKSKIVVPAASTCMAIVNAVRASGNVPIYCDLELETASLDSKKLHDLILTENPALAISPAHFGLVKEYDQEIYQVIKILEDNAQAFLSDITYPVRRDSYARIYSFYPTKGLNAIDGGAFVSHEEYEMNKCSNISNYDAIRNDDGVIRHNFRMNNVNCAVGLDSIDGLTVSINRRNEIKSVYSKVLENFDNVTFIDGPKTILQKFVLRFADEKSRNMFRVKMINHGIGASNELNYLPPKKRLVLDGARELSTTTCSIPFYETLSDQELDYVTDKLNKVLKAISD